MSRHEETSFNSSLVLVPFPVSQHGYVLVLFISLLVFPYPTIQCPKNFIFLSALSLADLAVHYMTQTLLPFTFLNSTFSSSPLIHAFLSSENVLQCEKAVFFKKILL
jgi:hypothetical protein